MATITDYASLVAAVIDHTTREDLGDSMDRFVQLAEQAMKRRLRSLDMETTVSLPITGSEVTLPSDLLSLRSVEVEGDYERPLSAAGSFASFDEMSDVGNTYRRSGSKLIIGGMWWEETEEVSLSITYVAAFTPLTAETTNFLIRDHPDVYFHGTLVGAFDHFRDYEAKLVAQSDFRNALEEVATSRNRDRYGSGVIAPALVRQVSGARC